MWTLRFGVLLLLVSLFGWERSGDVSGKVRFMDATLASGSVTFHYEDRSHPPVSGFIMPDGGYHISGCPAGDVRVTVHGELGRWEQSDVSSAAAIPVRYTDQEQTDLLLTIENGRDRIDIDLER